MDGRFDTPEAAALSGWKHTRAANARVVEVKRTGKTGALVVIELDGHRGYNRDLVTCEQDDDGKWRWTGSTGAGSPGF